MKEGDIVELINDVPAGEFCTFPAGSKAAVRQIFGTCVDLKVLKPDGSFAGYFDAVKFDEFRPCSHSRWCDWHGTSGARDVRRCWDCEEKEYRPTLQPNGILTLIFNAFHAHMMERLAATKGVVINLNR